MSITLTPVEQQLRKALLGTADYLHSKGHKVTLRFAGGWVRDKLLHLECSDLDIAVDTQTGYEFALSLNRHLKSQGSIPLKCIHKIASNPEKSKHLETASTRFLDLQLDFVNLRTEEYQSSRIPQTKFGTPLQDALRRDCTINSMFYNIHTQKIEDFTNSGLHDLHAKIIRTPLPPYQTFIDDPLRVLRCIRFASRFGFTIVLDAIQALQNPDIKEALKTKISRERIGLEVNKMLKGPDPEYAIRMICEFGLYNSVFATQTDVSASPAAKTVKWLLQSHPIPNLQPQDPPSIRLLYLSAVLLPLLSKPEGAELAVREALKLPTVDSYFIKHCFANISLVHQFANKPNRSRLETGLFVRSLGKNWPLIVTCAFVHYYTTTPTDTLINTYNNLEKEISFYNLTSAYALKPLLNGNQLAKLLNLTPGPQIKAAINNLLEWQLVHPDATAQDYEKQILNT